MNKALFALPTIVLCMVFGGCGGDSNKNVVPPPPPPRPPSNGIQTDFWGIHVNQSTDYPVKVPFGQFRGWDARGGQWPDIETCEASSGDPGDACFTWSGLDTELANVKQASVNDVMYTLSRTPPWASQNPNDPNCNYFNLGTHFQGACYPPVDLNPDGTGTNQIWKNWVTGIATRVNNPSYLQNHAHVKYWEIWNEFYRSMTIERFDGPLSWQGTYNQLVRLSEDAKCIITGKGTIHNWPAVGQTTPCIANPIDANALIVSPSYALGDIGLDAIQNFLYCNHNPLAACTDGTGGAQAVDIINPHLYAVKVTPETVANIQIPKLQGILQPAELRKPLWNGEGSWGRSTANGIWQSDAYARAGFIPRFFALYWSAGVTRNYWYGYDTDTGQLFDPSAQQLRTPEAQAWTVTNTWLADAVPKQSPFCQTSGTVYFCDFGKANGYVARLVWDTRFGQNCSQLSVPVLCGNSSYNVPMQFNKDWIDLGGTVHTASTTVTIGANPILLEGQQ